MFAVAPGANQSYLQHWSRAYGVKSDIMTTHVSNAGVEVTWLEHTPARARPAFAGKPMYVKILSSAEARDMRQPSPI